MPATGEMGMKRCTWILLVWIAALSSGCIATKIVSVPMRLTGAVVSIAPVVGNTAHDAIDEMAEKIDELP